MKHNDKFLIFKPAKSSMQSGLKNTNKWCLSNCEMNDSYISSKFCWNGSSNPEKRIKLFFKTLDEAKKFALKRNILFDYKQYKMLEFITVGYSKQNPLDKEEYVI